MDKEKLPVIAINREYGAGGRRLAALLSEHLGIPYYDKYFVEKTAQESGFDKDEVERESEELSKAARVIDSIFGDTVSYSSSHDAIFRAEKKVILELAKSPCIMVGRCADQILKEAGIDVLSIYLHAPFEIKLKRAQELGKNGELKLEKYMEKIDRHRALYYKQYTGCVISDARNYTFTFDVGKLGIEKCAEIVESAIAG